MCQIKHDDEIKTKMTIIICLCMIGYVNDRIYVFNQLLLHYNIILYMKIDNVNINGRIKYTAVIIFPPDVVCVKSKVTSLLIKNIRTSENYD